ncbi:MAG: GIY-YIG nuclease family protein [Desulfomonilia bacterium]
MDHECVLIVGKLGMLRFPEGYYAYAGSAFGPGGLRSRILHHLRTSPRPHWHIDYLRAHASIAQIWMSLNAPGSEHRWAGQLMNLPGASVLHRSFGSTDCSCVSHLVHTPRNPSLADFSRLVREQHPEDTDIFCLV